MHSLRAWWSNKIGESQDKGQEQTTRPLKKKRSLKNFPKIIHKRKNSSGSSSSVTEQRPISTVSTSDVDKKHQQPQVEKQGVSEEVKELKQLESVGPAPSVIRTEPRTLDSATDVSVFSSAQRKSPTHTVQLDSTKDESDANTSLEMEESISDSTIGLAESTSSSPAHSVQLHGVVFDEQSLKHLKEAENILSTLARRNRSSQERVSAKRLYWETKAKREGYKDPKWNVTKDEWAKLQFYHYNQEAAVTQILESLQLLQA